MICFGATNSLCSFMFGRLAEYTGRAPLFCLGKKSFPIKTLTFSLVSYTTHLKSNHLLLTALTAAAINFACIMALLFWRPHPDQLPVFFVFPALWGMADAVWQAQTNCELSY